MLSDGFRSAVETGEIAGSPELFHEDAVFLSPVVFRPYVGRDTVLRVLEAAERVLGVAGSFRYVLQLEDSAHESPFWSSRPRSIGGRSKESTNSRSTRTDASRN